jgi:hypothetical protein
VEKSFENVAKLKCVWTTVTHQNLTHEEEIKISLNFGNSCYNLVQNLLSSFAI